MEATTTKLVTARDLERLEDDDHRYDLIEGVLYRMPLANFEHGAVSGDLQARIWKFVGRHKLGVVLAAETGFFLKQYPDTVLGPDVAFVRTARLPPRETWRKGFPELAPDLVVEVVSPSESGPSVARKVAAYLAAGVVLVWTLDARRQTIGVHRAGEAPRTLHVGDVLDGEDVLPGFRLPVAEIFRAFP
ncbi:MAG: Uma2 family endonuclease [Thermomicrobiales bacterium]